MLAQLLTETLLGALTGYITNDTAIRSLFQPGGVIEKTRDDFAREAGVLLEEQVLTRAVLEEQLALPEVQRALREALHDFLEQHLPAALAQLQVRDLPDYEAMLTWFEEFVTRWLRQEQEIILAWLKKYLPPEELMDSAQWEQFAGQLEKLLLESLRQENFLAKIQDGWQRAHEEETLAQLGLEELCDRVIKNAAEASRQWPKAMKQQYGDVLRQLLTDTIQRLDLRPVLLELDGVMAQYTLGQYLLCEEKELQALLEQALDSEQGKALLRTIVKELLEAAETIEAPVSEILPPDIMKQAVPVLAEQLPAVMEEVLVWLEGNRQSVNVMLESAVDEIAGEMGGMKGMLLEQLKETVLAQVLEQNSLTELIGQTILDEQSAEETAAFLMQTIQSQLTEETVGSVIRNLNKKQALERALQMVLTDNLRRSIRREGTVPLQKLLEWKPGALNLAGHQLQVEELLADILLRGVEQLPVDSIAQACSAELKRMRVGRLVRLEEAELEKTVEQAVQYGCRFIKESMPKCSSDRLYRPLYEGLVALLEQNGHRWFREITEPYTAKTLLQAAKSRLLEKEPELLEGLCKVGLDMTRGQLGRLAENQIQQLSSADMLKLVQDLMGRELKPLNYLGAGMGAVAGATVGTALSAALPVTMAAGPAMMASVLAGKSAVFGAVGYTTNCAAVKGLFWPYTPVGGVEMLQGVIPKQKARFARSMGNLVERYVINASVLKELLGRMEPELALYTSSLARNEQSANRLAAELAHRRKQIVEPVMRWLDENGEQACSTLLKRFGEMPFAFLRTPLMGGRMLEEWLIPLAEKRIHQLLYSDISLNRIISGEQFWHLVQAVIEAQDIPDIKAWSHTLLASEKSLLQFAGDDTGKNLRPAVEKFVEHRLAQTGSQEKLVKEISRLLSAERLHNWLENHSTGWVEENLSSIFTMVERALLQLLQDRESRITAAVQSAILNRMGLMQQMGYAMMNGDAIVASVVERVLQQKLPIFLSVKSRELQQLLYRCWEETIFPAVLQMPFEQFSMEPVWKQIMAQPAVHQCTGRIAGQVFEAFAALPIGTWGRLLNLDGLITRLEMQLGFQWQRNRHYALTGWGPLVEELYGKTFGGLTIKTYTQGYDKVVSLKQLIQYEHLSEDLRSFQMRLQENIAVTRPQQWFHWPALSANAEEGIHQLLCDEVVHQWLEYEGDMLVLHLAESAAHIISPQTRAMLIQPVIQAAFYTAEAHGTRLLTAMDLPHLAETRLNAMDSAHLEQVVRGFAGHYLVHIQNRGWLGAVFALPGMLIYLY